MLAKYKYSLPEAPGEELWAIRDIEHLQERIRELQEGILRNRWPVVGWKQDFWALIDAGNSGILNHR